MRKPHTPAHFSELDLLLFEIPDFGWEGDRPALGDETVLQIGALLADKLSSEQIERLIADLKLGYANAAEVALVECELRLAADELADQKGQPNRPPVKLGVKIKNALKVLRSMLADKTILDDPKAVLALVNVLRRNPALYRLVNLLLEDRMGFTSLDPLDNDLENAAPHIPTVIEKLVQPVGAGVLPGSSSASLNYLAEWFVWSYRLATGELPKRIYSNYEKGDTGYEKGDTGAGLEVCRLLAKELRLSLPEKCRSHKSAEMTTPYRKAIRGIKETI